MNLNKVWHLLFSNKPIRSDFRASLSFPGTFLILPPAEEKMPPSDH
jgi:hypothetical protein